MKKRKIIGVCLCAAICFAATIQPVFAATPKKTTTSTAPVLTAAQEAQKKQLEAIMSEQAENARLEQVVADAYGETPTASVTVKNVLQKPELPNGCEATSLAMLINSEGINFTKDIVNSFMPKKGFAKVNNNSFRAGGNPENFFCGDPTKKSDAFYCFEGAVLSTVEAINKSYGISIKAKKLDKATESELVSQIDSGNAVMLWGTLSMGDPVNFSPSGWVDLDTGRFVDPYLNMHCVVLTGYNSDYFFVSDPIRGDVAYKRTTLMNAYEKMGSRAVIIESVM